MKKTITCFLVNLFCLSSYGFAPSLSSQGQLQPISTLTRDAQAQKTVCYSSSLSSEYFLLSFDGTIADTTEYRISQGIDVALETWPRLKELLDSFDEDDTWLRNKLRALSHCLISRPGVSLTCDYALLARCLMEEQELDLGRSNGCSGKYASKFHPQQKASSGSSRSNNSGRRPLTVGEISTNWNKGGCLAETLLTRYHVNYKNPLPILQQNLENLQQQGNDSTLPKVNDAVVDLLLDASSYERNIVVTVGHESEQALARKTLSSVSEGVKILPVQSTHKSLYEGFLEQIPTGSTVYVIDSSWDALEQGIALFGDNIPRATCGTATVPGFDNLQLSLNYPKWSSPSSMLSSSGSTPISQGEITQQNEAMMNPWTVLLDEQTFSELLSARIVSSSKVR